MNKQSEKLTFKSEGIKERLDKLYARQEKIRQEIEKAEAAYKQAQDLDSGNVVRLLKLTPREAAELLQGLKGHLPEAETEYDEKAAEEEAVKEEAEEEFDEEEETEEEDLD